MITKVSNKKNLDLRFKMGVKTEKLPMVLMATPHGIVRNFDESKEISIETVEEFVTESLMAPIPEEHNDLFEQTT